LVEREKRGRRDGGLVRLPLAGMPKFRPGTSGNPKGRPSGRRGAVPSTQQRRARFETSRSGRRAGNLANKLWAQPLTGCPCCARAKLWRSAAPTLSRRRRKRVSKKLHETVNYRAGTTDRHCSICAMYISRQQSNGASYCTAVVDPIQPKGMCDIFQKNRARDKRPYHRLGEASPVAGAAALESSSRSGRRRRSRRPTQPLALPSAARAPPAATPPRRRAQR
jgi:hypothetical protein